MGKTLDKIMKAMNIKNIHESKEAKRSYESWNDLRESLFQTPRLTEREHYIREIQTQCAQEKFAYKLQLCGKYGHVEASAINTGHGVYCTCGRCGLGYKRNAHHAENASWNNMMNRRMTI